MYMGYLDMAGLSSSVRLESGVGLRLDPRVVLQSRLLQLTQQELEQAIETELNENPALERLIDETEPITQESILKVVAPTELKNTPEDFEGKRSQPSDELPDWVEMAGCYPSLQEHLGAQLLPSLESRLRGLGEYLLGSLNALGYLETPIEEIALATNSLVEDVEHVVEELRKCEPAGVGALNVIDCLMLQLRDANTVESKLARKILQHHFEDFLNRKSFRISRRYRVMPEVVDAAFAEILSLTPYPCSSFDSSNEHFRGGSGVTPDLVFIRSEAGWAIEVKGPDPDCLSLDRSYKRRYRELHQMARPPQDERKHVTDHVKRAASFIESLYRRRSTLRQIGEFLLQRQAGFVQTGDYAFLRPLTRSSMAKALGLHESTVSRATMNKHVQLADGEVVPFEVFFKPALRVQKMIEQILQQEDPDAPLSDERVAALLAERGVVVARRTVNKYRDRGRMLSSRRRRSA